MPRRIEVGNTEDTIRVSGNTATPEHTPVPVNPITFPVTLTVDGAGIILKGQLRLDFLGHVHLRVTANKNQIAQLEQRVKALEEA